MGAYIKRKNPEIPTSTIEGYFSIFKRGMKGACQHCGKEHLHRYAAEFVFRYSNRAALGADDRVRADVSLKSAVGKRLVFSKSQSFIGLSSSVLWGKRISTLFRHDTSDARYASFLRPRLIQRRRKILAEFYSAWRESRFHQQNNGTCQHESYHIGKVGPTRPLQVTPREVGAGESDDAGQGVRHIGRKAEAGRKARKERPGRYTRLQATNPTFSVGNAKYKHQTTTLSAPRIPLPAKPATPPGLPNGYFSARAGDLRVSGKSGPQFRP